MPGAVPTGITDPFDPTNGPYDSDFDTFVFFEQETLLTSDLTLPGYPTIPAGTTVCSYFFHYSPADTATSTPPTTYNFGQPVLATAHSSGTLASTQSLGSPQSPSNQGFEGNPLNPTNSDTIAVNGSEVTFQNFAGEQFADNARILTECAPPPVATPLIQGVGDASGSSGNWTDNGNGTFTSNVGNANGAPNYGNTLEFTFVVPADGNYDLVGAVQGNGGSADSFWVDVAVDGVAFDEDPAGGGGTLCCNSWQWGGIPSNGSVEQFDVRDGTSGGGQINPGPFPFTAGQTVTVVVSNREAGTTIAGMELRQI